MQSPPPEQAPAADRTEARHRAALHAAWVWGGMLVLAALIFALLYGILSVRREKEWGREIRAALAAGDAPRAALLLEQCRREAPEVARSAPVTALAARLLELQERDARRAEQFAARVAALEKMLDDGSWRDRAMVLELAETAKLAPDEAALRQLEELRMRYEALGRKQSAEAALAEAAELERLRGVWRALETARRSGDWARYEALARQGSDMLARLKLASAGLPDLSGAVRELETALARETETGDAMRRLLAERRAAFRTVLEGGEPGIIARRRDRFLERYPDAPEAAELRNLARELKCAEVPYRTAVEQELARMNDRAGVAMRQFRLELLKLDAVWNAVPLGQLTVRCGDRTESFYTPEKAAFAAPDAAGRARIAFTDREKRPIAAEFGNNGDGMLTAGDAPAKPCTLKVPETPRNYLPRARYQELLETLRRRIEGLAAPGFPAFLSGLEEAVAESDGDLPEALRRDLAMAVLQAGRTLEPDHDPAARPAAGTLWEFQREFLTECAANAPVFVGVWHRPEHGQAEFFASRVTRARAEAWIPKGVDQFEAVGVLADSRLRPDADAPFGLHAVFSPAGEPADGARQAYWRRRSRQLGLPRPPYPAFWPVNRR